MIFWPMLLSIDDPDVAPGGGVKLLRVVIGMLIGVVGGVVITIALIVARAQFLEQYLHSVDDLIHWQSVPMLLTPAVGIVFGFGGRESFVGSILGSVGGMVMGIVLGAAIGLVASVEPEAPWAGGLIGAGVGMTIGGLMMGIRGLSIHIHRVEHDRHDTTRRDHHVRSGQP